MIENAWEKAIEWIDDMKSESPTADGPDENGLYRFGDVKPMPPPDSLDYCSNYKLSKVFGKCFEGIKMVPNNRTDRALAAHKRTENALGMSFGGRQYCMAVDYAEDKHWSDYYYDSILRTADLLQKSNDSPPLKGSPFRQTITGVLLQRLVCWVSFPCKWTESELQSKITWLSNYPTEGSSAEQLILSEAVLDFADCVLSLEYNPKDWYPFHDCLNKLSNDDRTIRSHEKLLEINEVDYDRFVFLGDSWEGGESCWGPSIFSREKGFEFKLDSESRIREDDFDNLILQRKDGSETMLGPKPLSKLRELVLEQSDASPEHSALRALCVPGADLARADLIGSNLRKVDLTGANLEGAVLTNANLSLANLTRARLKGARLKEAKMVGAILKNADLSLANLCEANLTHASLRGANLRFADLRGAKLNYASLCETDLKGANLKHCGMVKADLSDADLRGANLTNADMFAAHLNDADLRVANLTGVDLRHAKLKNTNLTGAWLSGANLVGADLSGADLTGADLTGAVLGGTNLEGAILKDLKGAKFTELGFLGDGKWAGFLNGGSISLTDLPSQSYEEFKSKIQAQIKALSSPFGERLKADLSVTSFYSMTRDGILRPLDSPETLVYSPKTETVPSPKKAKQPMSIADIASNVGSTIAEGAKEGLKLAAAHEFNLMLSEIIMTLLEKAGVPPEQMREEPWVTVIQASSPVLLLILCQSFGDQIPARATLEEACQMAIKTLSFEKINPILAGLMPDFALLTSKAQAVLDPARALTEGSGQASDIFSKVGSKVAAVG